MSIVGCYVVHLYCDDPKHRRGVRWDGGMEYTGNTLRACLKQARRWGWEIARGKARCPSCVTAKGAKCKGA